MVFIITTYVSFERLGGPCSKGTLGLGHRVEAWAMFALPVSPEAVTGSYSGSVTPEKQGNLGPQSLPIV